MVNIYSKDLSLVIRLCLFPQDDIYLTMSMWANIWGLQTNGQTPMDSVE